MLKSLLAANAESTAGMISSAGGGAFLPSAAGQLAGGNAALSAPSYDDKLAAAKNISGHDPAKVAQVVKKWVKTDAA